MGVVSSENDAHSCLAGAQLGRMRCWSRAETVPQLTQRELQGALPEIVECNPKILQVVSKKGLYS